MFEHALFFCVEEMSVNFLSKLNEKYNFVDEGVGFYLRVSRILRKR